MLGTQDRYEYTKAKIEHELEYLYAASLDDDLDEEELFYIEEDIRYLQAQKALYYM